MTFNTYDDLKNIFETIDSSVEELINETIEISETKAPPFKEEIRGRLIKSKFDKLGYKTQIDEIGNVIATKDFSNSVNPIVLSAHLDTVFPEDVDVKVGRDGYILHGPGVGDDSRGLAVLLFIAKITMNIDTINPIVFLATVGEEGLGDLRGIKYFFGSEEDKNFRPKCFITIDGTGSNRIIIEGVGSLRYRIHIKGPGGHSYGNFGIVNPAYALAHAIDEISNIKVSKKPKTTHNIGIIGGGTSINAIPSHVWAELDIRSESNEKLNNLDIKIKSIIKKSIEGENLIKNDKLVVEIEELGNRPSGKLNDHKLKELLINCNSKFNLNYNFVSSSTDANIPMSLGIPAFCLAGVEKSNKAHTTQEWIDASKDSLVPVKRNLLVLLEVDRYFGK